jgi:hypothetical protein
MWAHPIGAMGASDDAEEEDDKGTTPCCKTSV